jgi:hypothetical protein
MISRRMRASIAFALGAAALGVVATTAVTHRAHAEGNDGMGTEAVVEALRAETIRRDAATGWSSGVAILQPLGNGKYSLSYGGPTHGGLGMRGMPLIIGNGDGNPTVEYRSAPTDTALTRR